MLNRLILAASAFIVTISSVSSTIPNDVVFKNLLKNHILLILKDDTCVKYVLKSIIVDYVYGFFYYNLNFFFRYNSPLLPNIVEQAVKDSNEYLISKNKPPLTQDVISMIETQVLSIKEPDHKIRTLVGNVLFVLKLLLEFTITFDQISDIEKRVRRQLNNKSTILSF